MAHGDVLRTVRVTDKTGQFVGQASVLEVNLSDADTTVALVAASSTSGKKRRIAGGYIAPSAAMTLGFVRDDDSTKLAGDVITTAANQTVRFEFEEDIQSAADEPIKVTRSASGAIVGEIWVMDVD